MRRLYPFLCLLSLLGVAACLWLAPGASAVVLRLPGRTVGYQPPRSQGAAAAKQASAESKRLVYHGGPVMTSNTNYPLYWSPSGEAAYPAGYISGIDRWFADLAHDSGGLLNTDSILVQYGDTEGGFGYYNSHFGGAAHRHRSLSGRRLQSRGRLPHRRTAAGRAAELRRRPRAPGRSRARVLRTPATGRVDLLRSRRASVLGRDRALQVLRLPQLLQSGLRDIPLHRQPLRRHLRMRGRKPQRKPVGLRDLRRPRTRAQRHGHRS